MSRPLIGVTTSEVRLAEHTDPLPEGDPPQREMALGMVYMRAIELAGGIPVVLPPLGHDTIAPLLERLGGVCLSGGPDIDPDGYGEEARNPQLGTTEPDARRLRARARPARRRARDAGARHLPRRADAQRRARRHAAPARRDLTDGSIEHRQTERGPRHDPLRADRARLAARARDGRDRGRRQLLPPPGGRPPRPGAARGRLGAGRSRRGDRERRATRSTSACSGTPSRSSTAPSTCALFRELVAEADASARGPGGARGMTRALGRLEHRRAPRRRGRSASRRR